MLSVHSHNAPLGFYMEHENQCKSLKAELPALKLTARTWNLENYFPFGITYFQLRRVNFGGVDLLITEDSWMLLRVETLRFVVLVRSL